MRVSLRTEKISKGRESLYLDVYIDKNNSYQKRLKMYLEPVRSQEDKARNREVLKIAEIIRNKYELDLLSKRHGNYNLREKYSNSFIEYFNTKVSNRYEVGTNYHTWYCCQKHLNEFTKKELTFDQVNEVWLETFKIYLNSRLSINSSHGYFNVLKNAVHTAFREKLLDFDPAYNVKSPAYKNPKREFLTENEFKELLKYDCRYPVLKNAFLFSIMTGLRWSDIQNLKWREVIVEGNQAYLNYTQRKTQEAERLPIHKDSLSFIGERQAENERVFKGLKYSDYFNVALQKWVMKAGITKKITFHCARHTHACLLINKGVDLFTVSKLLGHKDIKTTQIYAKLVNKTKEDAINKLPSIFEL